MSTDVVTTTQNQFDHVVDRLAEKLGVAVDKIQPLAEDTLHQYIVREWFLGIVWLLVGAAVFFLGVSLVIGKHGVKSTAKDKQGDWAGQKVAAIAFGGLMAVVGFVLISVLGIEHISRALSPLPSILGL